MKNVPEENVYLHARQEWNERYGDYIAAAAQWRLIAFISLAISVICVMGLVYLGSRNHIVPYVVEVNKLGESLVVSPAEQAKAPDNRIIQAQLANWISNIRSIYTDAGAERAVITNGYNVINKNGPAFKIMNDYFQTHDPFTLAQTQTVNVTVESVLPISATTWRIEWSETVRALDGSMISQKEWQAAVSIIISPPKDQTNLYSNPMGIYVDNFSWSERF